MNFDIFALAGRNKGLVRELDATPNASGQLVVQFFPAPNADQPTASGLEAWKGPDLTPPRLLIGMENGSVQLEWPASATMFHLYGTEALLPPSWAPIMEPPVVNGDTKRVTLPAQGPGYYFMLSAP